eukprot:2819501-Amphidinium_carterae.1
MKRCAMLGNAAKCFSCNMDTHWCAIDAAMGTPAMSGHDRIGLPALGMQFRSNQVSHRHLVRIHTKVTCSSDTSGGSMTTNT